MRVLLLVVQDRIRTGIVRVGYDALATRFDASAINLFDELNNASANIVHVEDGRRRVEARRVEVVGIGHGDAGKRVKVLGLDRCADLCHALRYD